MTVGYVCSFVGMILAIISIIKRSFSYATYTVFMFVQACGLYITNCKIVGIFSVITLIALLLTGREDS